MEKFWSKVLKTDGCWIWQGSLTSRGYGHFWFHKHFCQSHRVAWEITNGPIPVGFDVCHHCDTPACVRPDHLFLGTVSDNMQDARTKNRWNPHFCNQPTKEKHPKAILTIPQVKEIKNSNLSQRKIAKIYKVSRGTIQGILSGKTWIGV